MNQLEQAMKQAHEDFQPWPQEKIEETLKCITSRFSNAKYDWEEGTENWGVIWQPERGVAYVCAKVPLIIVAEVFANEIRKCVSSDNAVILNVGNFDDQQYKIDKKLLEIIFSKALTSVVSYEALSIRELWYATVD